MKTKIALTVTILLAVLAFGARRLYQPKHNSFDPSLFSDFAKMAGPANALSKQDEESLKRECIKIKGRPCSVADFLIESKESNELFKRLNKSKDSPKQHSSPKYAIPDFRKRGEQRICAKMIVPGLKLSVTDEAGAPLYDVDASLQDGSHIERMYTSKPSLDPTLLGARGRSGEFTLKISKKGYRTDTRKVSVIGNNACGSYNTVSLTVKLKAALPQ